MGFCTRVRLAIVDGLQSRQRTIGSAWSSDGSAFESRQAYARYSRLAATAATFSPAPSVFPYSGHPCHRHFQQPDSVIVLRGRSLVRVARLRGRVPEDADPSMGSLCGIFCCHISLSVRMVPGVAEGLPVRSAGRLPDRHRRPAVAATSCAHPAPPRSRGLPRRRRRDRGQYDD